MDRIELIDRLSDDKKDERTGIEAIRGFTFQVWWAACKALELLKEDADFVVVLEYKQDVAIPDGAAAPTRLKFFQIKKNEGVSAAPWSVDKLSAIDKSAAKPPRSILGKLLQHRPRFPGTPVTLGFITNNGFSYGSPKVECEEILLHDLPDEVLAKVKAALAEDLGIPEAKLDLNDFRLERTHMPIESQERWACGILDEVEACSKLPFKIPNKGASAQVLAAQFLARAGKRAFAKDFTRLLERGLTRAQIIELLRKASGSVQRDTLTVAQEVCQRLDFEQYDYEEVEMMRDQIPCVCIDLTNPNHPDIGKLWKLASEGKAACRATSTVRRTFGADLDAIVAWLQTHHPAQVKRYEPAYLKLVVALTIKDVHGQRNFTSAADSK